MAVTDLAPRNGTEAQFSGEQLDLIKRTVAKGVTDEELKLFLYTAASRGLDPLLRQVHAVSRRDNRLGRDVMSIQVGIDGYRLLADRTHLYAGNDEPEYGSKTDAGFPEWARVTVWKIVGGTRCPFTATARWTEYFPGDSHGFMWKKMPHLMLSKCAEALALRKAFPSELSGIYTAEEMEQAGPASYVDAEVVEPPRPAEKVVTPKPESLRDRYTRLLAIAKAMGLEVVELPEGAKTSQATKWCEITEKLIADELAARDAAQPEAL